MAFSRLSTGRSGSSLHSAEFACELGGKVGGIVAITRAPLARTMSGNVVDPIAGRADIPLNHFGAPPSRRSKRTMSQIRRVCPPDAQLKRMIRKVLLSDPDMRFGAAVTMGTRQRCMKQLEDECGCSLKHKTGFIHKELERISLGPADKRRKTANAQASSATEAMLMSELTSKLERKANSDVAGGEQVVENQIDDKFEEINQPEKQEKQQVDDDAMPLGRTTSELEQQLLDALDDAQDVLQHSEDAFDTTIPTDSENSSLPDLISPETRPDDEQADDTSYITVTSEEVNHACGNLLPDAETDDTAAETDQHVSKSPQSVSTDQSSPIDQLSALRERLRQIRCTDAHSKSEAEDEEPVVAQNSPVATVVAARDDEADKADEAPMADTQPSSEVAPAVNVNANDAIDEVAKPDTEAVEKTESYRTVLEHKSRKELQKLAKEHGIKANLSSSKIIDALCSAE